jgi:hypothetical protein
MKNILATLVLFLTLAFAGCDDEGIDLGGPNMGYAPVARKEYPAVNPPLGLRQPNWLGRQGEGSCVHANMVTLFHWQGHHQMAVTGAPPTGMVRSPTRPLVPATICVPS